MSNKYPEYKYNLSNADRTSIAQRLPSTETMKRTILMEVELFEKLKVLSKQDMNLSSFIRTILWEYVDRFEFKEPMDNAICSFGSIAIVPLTCSLTGERIEKDEKFNLVYMPNQQLYPVKINETTQN